MKTFSIMTISFHRKDTILVGVSTILLLVACSLKSKQTKHISTVREILNPKKNFFGFNFTFNKLNEAILLNWGGSRGGSGGSIEPPKVNVKTENKRVVKKSEPAQLINISFENDISLCLCTRNSKQQ